MTKGTGPQAIIARGQGCARHRRGHTPAEGPKPLERARSMAHHAGVSPSTVQRIWANNDLKPHITKTFKLSNDPKFEEKFWDVIGLYLDPPEKALVLCCDEKSQCQALERSQPVVACT
jgi:hypothetical protein